MGGALLFGKERAIAIGIEELRRNGLRDWRVVVRRLPDRRLGERHRDLKTIVLSRFLLEWGDEDEIRETVLHEVAHALVLDEDEEHGPRWRAACNRLGCSTSPFGTLKAYSSTRSSNASPRASQGPSSAFRDTVTFPVRWLGPI